MHHAPNAVKAKTATERADQLNTRFIPPYGKTLRNRIAGNLGLQCLFHQHFGELF
jgi:hypothetical protein